MKKILKKRVLIIMFMAIAIWGMNANKEVKAAVEGTKDTDFGSISINSPSFEQGQEKYLNLKISFQNKGLDESVTDYAGIVITVSAENQYESVKFSNFKSYDESGWELTARSGVSDGYKYIFEKKDISSSREGDKNVTLNLNFGMPTTSEPGTNNIAFTVKDVQISSSKGKGKKYEQEYQVTSEVKMAPFLQSNSDEVEVVDNGFDDCNIKLRTGSDKSINTWQELKSALTNINQYTEVEIKNFVGTTRNEGDNVCTGKLILTYEEKTRVANVWVIGDCWQKNSGEQASEKIDINDVFVQRYRAVGCDWSTVQNYVDDGSGMVATSSADVNDSEKGEVDITDIILTRRRIVDNKWLVDE